MAPPRRFSPRICNQRPNTPAESSDHKRVAAAGFALHQNRGNRTPPAVELRFDDQPFGDAWDLLQLQHLCLQAAPFPEVRPAQSLLGGHFTMMVSPPQGSGINHVRSTHSSRVDFDPGLSTLLMATMSGTPAALA